MAEVDPNNLASVYGIPSDTAQKLIDVALRYTSEVDVDEERVDAAGQEPLSGWDAVAYADYRWDDSEVNPLTGLGLLLQYIGFDRAWAEVVRCTRPADIDALIQWGNAFLRARNRPYDATIPDDVRAAW